MRRQRRELEIFSLYFLDGMCCAFGAVIMLLLITKAAEPRIIEQAKVDERGLIAALQKELFEIRGEASELDRRMKSAHGDRQRADATIARLQADLGRIRGQYAASRQPAVNTELEGQLRATRQRLTEEMRRLLADYRPPKDEATVGGIPVDSEYIIFVIDTSGSMFQGPWQLVMRKISEVLRVYPRIRGIQVMSDEGKYMFPSYTGKWIPDSPTARQQILSTLANWNPYSDSSPVEGIAEAISTFYEPGKPVSIYVFGDDFPSGQVEAVARYVERINKADASGHRLMRIHGVGFPTQFAGGRMGNGLRFANLMRTLCERNGGTFVALTTLN
ncbi:MAG: VWA domain-containing protein [Gammaproteobacteria bacterium]|nr:VWA domain-containing protein [Gammaproteobacteria bacterium PRO8]MCL4776478.1 VWA domain-containing protein [Gammaproteobacteria bacterium]